MKIHYHYSLMFYVGVSMFRNDRIHLGLVIGGLRRILTTEMSSINENICSFIFLSDVLITVGVPLVRTQLDQIT